MKISFATAKLQKLCNSDKKLRGEFGPACAKKIRHRLSELEAAVCLEDMRQLPQARCHELKANRKGQLAVDLEHPKRMIFEPDHDPKPELSGGGLDWKKVTHVCIVEIKDYHKG